MKRAIYISILCTVMLTACGNVSESTKSAGTSDVSQTAVTVTSAKEEKDTSEAATTTRKSSQTVSETSKPIDTTVTTTKKSDPSGYSGNSSQGQNNSAQNNNGQENNYQPVQNDPQPDNSPSDNNRSNNGAEQNNRPSDNKPQNNDPTPPTTTAKPAVTNPPTTTTPKPQITVPQTEVVIEDTTNLQSVLNYVNSLGRTTDEYYNIGAGLSHDGSDYGKAEAVYNWIRDNVSGNCQVFSVATIYACKGIGLECRYAFFSPDDWYGHMANLVNVGGAWYVFDTQGGRFLKSDKYGDITQIFDENDNTIELSVSESAY
ncbi:hypothetical protein [uncultured Ruminococcus sp.]|uniref:hypothetical protein n=1 Tax=uncultured Ruminococcus sp. TaxID=165186 RepID=UPI0025EF6FB5|nr:hypothetical protein [uncultured Ruminococcus sp.]